MKMPYSQLIAHQTSPRLIQRLLVCLLSCSAVACSGEGELDGSISDVYRLGHDDVRARLYSSELSIEFTKNDGSVPVRVSLRIREIEPKAGESYDLGDYGAITGQLADGTSIPPFIDGALKLDEFKASDGAEITGSFSGKFDGVRDVLSINGEFDTTLELVRWPDIPQSGLDALDASTSMGDAGP